MECSHVASKTSAVLWVANEEDTLDGVESIARQVVKSIDSGSGTLRVTFEDEALIRVGSKSGCDLVDNLCRYVSKCLIQCSTEAVLTSLVPWVEIWLEPAG